MSVIRARSPESTALRWGRDGPAATAGRRDAGARRSPPRARGGRLSDGRRLLRHRAHQPRRAPDRPGGAHDRHAPLRRRRGLADGGARAAVLLRRARVFRAVRGPERRAHARQAGVGDPRRDGDRAPRHSHRGRGASDGRSEEHTSELQSQSNFVCRLLLEKKKKTVEARDSPYSTKQLIDAVAEVVDRKVNLNSPDKILQLEVLTEYSAMSALNPDDLVSVV